MTGQAATGETNLQKLLGSMSPELVGDVFAFCMIPLGASVPAGVDPVMMFREREGMTLIVSEAEARAAGMAVTFPCRMITLNIHSSLDAVGFLAVITGRLSSAGIGVNPVSAYLHDHLFVPQDRADEAMSILGRISKDASASR